jgi:dTDP-4-dehydrorhamnose reductase
VGNLVVERAAAHHDVRGLAHAELDITDPAAVQSALREFSPHVVLHCAAYTDVDGAERHRSRAFEVNAEGTEQVAVAAKEQGSKLVYVSTDYVFDGKGVTPYRESDATGPLSVYAHSKLEGERRVESACPEDFIIVRTGWLYGRGRGFVDWATTRLLASEELPLVDDQKGSPTYAADLADALVELATSTHRGVFHFVNQGAATWLDLGRAVAEELDLGGAKLAPIHGDALGRPAPRPAYSALSVEHYEKMTGKRARSWREALRAYLADD